MFCGVEQPIEKSVLGFALELGKQCYAGERDFIWMDFLQASDHLP